MSGRVFLAAVMLAGSALAAATPRISFQRTIPAPHNPAGAEDIAIVYAIGDNERVSTFVDALVDHGNRSNLARIYNATSSKTKVRADLRLRVTSFACRNGERSGEASVYDTDGNRVRRRQKWATAECSARIEVLGRGDESAVSSFRVKGEGTSSRSERVTREETGVALDEAAHYAARAALEQIVPRTLRETIELDPEAPAFAEGFSMVQAGRLIDARRIWERALRRDGSSAALRHNLAAVCEALGDVNCASLHFAEAQRLDPASVQHKIELEMFRRRNSTR